MPAQDAIIETTLAGLFRVREEGGVAGQVENGFELRRCRLNAAFRITLNQVARDIPALNRIREVDAEINDIAARKRCRPGLHEIIPPDFHQHVNVTTCEAGDERQGRAWNGVGLAAIAFFKDDPRHLIVKGRGVPVEAAKHDRAVNVAGFGMGGRCEPEEADDEKA